MSDFICDPRPLLPPDYFDKEMSNIATCMIQRTTLGYDSVSREFRKDVKQTREAGNVKDILELISIIYAGDAPEECDIFIDATEIIPNQKQKVHFTVKSVNVHDVRWVISADEEEFESGDDSDELLAATEYMLNEQKQFKISFDAIDPTPQFLYDHSGGEAPMTMREICDAAFQQKQELRK